MGALEVGKHFGSRLQPYVAESYRNVAYRVLPQARSFSNLTSINYSFLRTGFKILCFKAVRWIGLLIRYRTSDPVRNCFFLARIRYLKFDGKPDNKNMDIRLIFPCPIEFVFIYFKSVHLTARIRFKIDLNPQCCSIKCTVSSDPYLSYVLGNLLTYWGATFTFNFTPNLNSLCSVQDC